MAVANGQDAGLACESLIRGGMDQGEREAELSIRQQGLGAVAAE